MLCDAEFKQICDDCGLTPLPLQPCAQLSMVGENEVTESLRSRAAQDSVAMNFLAAGAYRSFIPAGIRAERLQTAVSRSFQGEVLDANYRKQQSLLEQAFCTLTEMPACTLLAQDVVSTLVSVLSSEFSTGDATKVLISATVAPAIRHALRSRLKHQAIELIVVDYDKQSGTMQPQQLQAYDDEEIAAVVVAWPNFFSLLEDIEQISRWTKSHSASLIVLADPLALNLMQTPFASDTAAVDFILGDCASLGMPANRQGCAPSFVLSAQRPSAAWLEQARKQTISELPLLTAFMQRLAAPDGLQELAHSRQLMQRLLAKLMEVPQISLRFSAPQLLEGVIRLDGIDLQSAQRILSGHNMLPGYFLADEYPELQDCLLLSCSGLQRESDIDKFAGKMATVVKNLSTAGCPVKPKF
jgi:glycine dehydrogenase subunit 1